MKLDKDMGANDVPAAGAERCFQDAYSEVSLREEREKRDGLEVWSHIVIPAATLVVAVLVFLFGTDVIGGHDGSGMPGDSG